MKKLNSLAFLKFVAMLLIIWWHIGQASGNIDLGARMCEFLFVASGFLVGYNYYKKGMNDSRKFSFDYVFGKFKKIWPLHIILLIGIMVLNYKTMILNFQLSDIPILLANIFLLQAWSLDIGGVAFSYNGVSWFLSALLFCYFLAPLFIKFIKNKKIAIMSFIIVATIRAVIEILSVDGINIFYLAMHTSPIIRSLEFFLGLLMVPIFMSFKEKLDKFANKTWFTITCSIVEIIAIVSVYFIMLHFNNSWLRFNYVLISCIFVFIVSFDYSYLAKITSFKWFQNLSSLQLEMYLSQIVISTLVDKIVFNLFNIDIPFVLLFTIKIATILLIAFIYKKFISQYLENFMSKIYISFKKNFN